jgi:hypothetical protein
MTPHDIDAKRFEYLIRRGISEPELRDFFMAHKSSLIMAGERVQNLPSDLHAAVRRFSAGAQAIFRTWLSRRGVDPTFSGQEVIAHYRAVEEVGVQFSKDEQATVDRSALLLLYRDPPPEDLVAFLRTPIVNVAGGTPRIRPPLTEDWLAFIARCRAAASDAKLDHPVLLAGARLLAALDRRDRALLGDADEAVNEAFEHEIDRLVAQEGSGKPTILDLSGVQVHQVPVRSYDEDTEYAHLMVIATRTSAREAEHVPWFARVEAFVDESGIFTLRREDIRRAIPTEGEVVIHKDRGLAAPPVGEARLYQVERIHNDYRAKVRVVALLPHLIPIIHVPFPSSEGQRIRKFITEHAASAPVEHPLFVTADNVCLSTQGIALNRVTRPEHDWRLDCWSHLDGYELSNGTYILGPLPPPETVLDCAPLPTVARRLIKAAAERSELTLTKGQRDTLIEILGDDSFHASPLTRRRLVDNLASIDRGHDDYKELVDALLEVPQIKRDVEDKVQEQVAQRLAERAAEAQKVENLKQESRALEATIKKLERDRTEKARAVRATIRRAFAAAAQREVDALGELSFLGALLPSARATKADQPIVRPAEEPIGLSGSVAPASGEQLNDILSAFGVPEVVAEGMADVLWLAAWSGVAIVIEGAGAGELGTRLAAALSKTAVRSVDVAVGAIKRALPEEWFVSADCDVMLLRHANLSDLGVYGPSLLASVSKRALSGGGCSVLPRLVLTGAPGAAAIPWPAEIRILALKLDLAEMDQILGASGIAVVQPGHPLQRALMRRVEHIAANNDCSKDTVQLLGRLMASAGA